MNTKKFQYLIKLCKMKQEELMGFLPKVLKKYDYKNIIKLKNNYIYAKGTLPIMVVAHLDTVHEKSVEEVFVSLEDFDTLSSPQGLGGDDRCGVYIITKLLKKGYRPSVLFVCDEEIGCLGAQKFCDKHDKLDNVNFIVEFDRRGKDDVVRYEDDNERLTRIIEEFGFKEAYGSCSDISYLAPHFKVSAVNISSGYYHEHHQDTTIKFSEVQSVICRFEKFLNSDYIYEKIEYKETEYYYNYNYYNHYSGFSSYYPPKKSNHTICDCCFSEVKMENASYIDGLMVCDDCKRQYSETLGLVECENCGSLYYEEDGYCEYCGCPNKIDEEEEINGFREEN